MNNKGSFFNKRNTNMMMITASVGRLLGYFLVQCISPAYSEHQSTTRLDQQDADQF